MTAMERIAALEKIQAQIIADQQQIIANQVELMSAYAMQAQCMLNLTSMFAKASEFELHEGPIFDRTFGKSR